MDLMPAFSAVLSKTLASKTIALTCAIAIGCMASPAMAEPEASAKLVRCGAESCLRVSGYRDDPAATVRINGNAVSVEGERRWQVHLPIEIVRQWSPPYARTIEVSLQHPEMQSETNSEVDLPVGMLGRLTDISSLVVSVY